MPVTRYRPPMSLLERAIDAHGGAERWAATEALDVTLHARGPAFTLKGRRGRQVRATLQTDRPLVAFRDFPTSGRTGVFDAGRVRIDGEERSAADARAAAGRVRWDDLGELYFDGLLFPARRRVHPRLPGDRPLRAVTLVAIDVASVSARPRAR